MTAEELEILIKQGEGYNVEFKRAIPSKASDLADEICAFANAAGGVVIIGVDDNGKTVGVTMDNVTRSRLQNVLNTIEPKLDVSVQELTRDRKTIVCLQCTSGKYKPYTVSGSIIIRNGPNSEKITSVQQMRDFFQQSDKIFFDEIVCSDFNYPKDFDDDFFNRFLKASGISKSLPTETMLENLNLVEDDMKFKNGAVLFFGRNPQQFMEMAVTRCLLFKGVTKTYILDDKVISGPLVNQYEGAIDYLRQKLNLNYIIQGAGPRREELEIPETVLKEAIINALCHRDYYEKGAVTMIEIFDDRVEISNPGGLVHSIPKEDFGRRSLARNPLIFGLFQRMELVEQVGSGISRMREGMKEIGLPEPVFSLEGIFAVRFYRPMEFGVWLTRLKDNLTETQVSLLQLVHSNNSITKAALAAALNISATSVDTNIDKLKAMGILERTGSRKAGQWKITQRLSS